MRESRINKSCKWRRKNRKGERVEGKDTLIIQKDSNINQESGKNKGSEIGSPK